MIQPVAVLPRLAPMTTPIACVKEISPALTKPIRVTVVAVEDWASAVIKAPDAKALMGLPVKASRICLREPPAKATSPSDSSIMPIRKRPSPPKKGKRVSSIKECEQRNKWQIPAGKVGQKAGCCIIASYAVCGVKFLSVANRIFMEAHVANAAPLNFFVYKCAWVFIAKERAMWIFVRA